MVLKFIFFQHYWELINVHHCTTLRCTTTWYSDLHRLWNDYQNRFSKCPSPYIDTIKRKERKKGKKKKVSLRWELIFHSLTGFPTCHTEGWAKVIMLHINYIPSTYVSYIYTFDHLPPFPLLPPLTSGNQKSDLFFCKFALLFNISCIF